jgi:hypothetical protein
MRASLDFSNLLYTNLYAADNAATGRLPFMLPDDIETPMLIGKLHRQGRRKGANA